MSIKPIKAGKNKWRVVVSMGKSIDGKRLRHIETITGKHSDAIRRRNELEVLREKGIITPQVRLTLSEHLKNWLEGYVKSRCGPRTIESYESIIKVHLIPNLGHYQLRQINHQSIENYYAEAKKTLNPWTKKTLTPRTVAKHHRLLSQALKYAVKHGFLAVNPCDLVDAPKWQPRRMRALNKQEAAIFLNEASSSIYYPVYYTAISTGLRQSELCGLHWRDLHLDTTPPSLSVCQTLYKRKGICETKLPKTTNSLRQIRLTKNLANFLGEHKAEWESFYWHLSKPLPSDSYVFAVMNKPDKPCDPSMLSHDFAIIARKAGLEGVRFHDLRHTFASLALERGAPAKAVSEALGHASVAFTLQTYAHVIGDMQEKTMELLNEVLPAGVNKNSVTFLSPES